MMTETIDKLFLELSQVAQVKTQKEIELELLLKCVSYAWLKDGINNVEGHHQLYNRAMARLDLPNRILD